MSQLPPEVTVAPMVDCFDRLSTWLSKGVVVDGLTVTTEETKHKAKVYSRLSATASLGRQEDRRH